MPKLHRNNCYIDVYMPATCHLTSSYKKTFFLSSSQFLVFAISESTKAGEKTLANVMMRVTYAYHLIGQQQYISYTSR